ncbi:MAG: alanyl-tRNA editing protein, partial [Candidatus Zixiibacteriota bacterium]
MTRKLYLDNAYRFSFESGVIAVHESESGFEVILDTTAFYPESGGQLFDLGTLDGAAVFNVVENDRGEVIHLVDRWDAAIGQTVRGEIDHVRRLDNMRKHTGQHILSRAFIETACADTVSAHLGQSESTIELSAEAIGPNEIEDAESLANEIVWQNLPVKIAYCEREKLKHLPVRKIPEREGHYRIIQVGEFDYT